MEFLMSPWGFASVSILSISIIVLVWRVGYISLSKAGLIVGKHKQEKVSPHTTCPYAGDIMDIIHQTAEYIERKQEIKYHLLEDQMRFYEESEEEIMGHMKKTFLKILETKLVTDESYVQHPEYMAYTVTLKALAADIKPYIKGCFKTNHYADYTLDEQLAYIDKKTSVVFQKITEGLNLYWRGTVVARGELYTANRKDSPMYEEYITNIFQKAFTLAREAKLKVEMLDKAYNAFIQSKLGHDQPL